MKTISLVEIQNQPSLYSETSKILEQGRLICFPTPSGYKLGADMNSPAAVTSMIQAKRRVKNAPALVFLPDTSWVEKVAAIGRERQKQLIDYSLRLLRENFILHLEHDSLNYLSAKESEFSRKFSPFIHEDNVFALAEDFTLAGNHIEANGNPRIILMDLSIGVIRRLKKPGPAEG